MDKIDHQLWDQLLRKYVNDKGLVNYAAWKKSQADSSALDAYLNTLSTANSNLPASREAKLAYWINAYNAVTVKGILREYPTSSIRNHTARVIGYNIWKNLLLTVGDSQISLDSIEHKVLRTMNEPRIHFAIVCASISCPRLLNEAYTSEKLEQQLVVNSKDFFANSQNFAFDRNRNQFQLSAILKWFGTDFGSDQAAQLKAIGPYLPTEQARSAAASGRRARVSYLEYDWGLNDVK